MIIIASVFKGFKRMQIGIIGLGLMGGSLGLSLKKLHFVSEIYGFDHNPEHCKSALELSLIDQVVSYEQILGCDVIFMAIPVEGIITLLQGVKHLRDDQCIIDLGSTKEIIINALPQHIRKNFVAAHPMTGTENFGPHAAIENLYKDKVVVLCDLEHSGKIQQENAVRIFSGIHMQLHYMHAHEHDRHAAFISHMPHAISYAIANSVLAQEDKENILALAAGGFRSMSRLAKSSPAMWSDIFKQNRENLLDAIAIFKDELSKIEKEIKESEWEKVHQQLRDANRLSDIFN